MAKEVYVNSKDLPVLSDMKQGDYFFTQTPTGIKLLDYAALILGKENTLITATVEQNTNSIISLSSEFITSTKSLSDDVQSAINSNTYVGYTNIIIPIGAKFYYGQLTPSTTKTITIKDIIVIPANEYAAKFPAYVSKLDNGTITIQGTFSKNIIVKSADTINYSLSSYTTSEKLSTFTSEQYLSTVVVDPTNFDTLISNLSLSTVSIAAEENAEYNIFVIKN